MKEPEIVDATQAQIDELLVLAKTTFPAEQYKLLQGVLATYVYVMLKLQNAKISIKRLRGMLFGHSTEHKRNLLGSAVASPDAQGSIAAGLTVPASWHSDTNRQEASASWTWTQCGVSLQRSCYSPMQSQRAAIGGALSQLQPGPRLRLPAKALGQGHWSGPPWRHSL